MSHGKPESERRLITHDPPSGAQEHLEETKDITRSHAVIRAGLVKDLRSSAN